MRTRKGKKKKKKNAHGNPVTAKKAVTRKGARPVRYAVVLTVSAVNVAIRVAMEV